MLPDLLQLPEGQSCSAQCEAAVAVSPPAAGFGSISVCTIPFSAESQPEELQDWAGVVSAQKCLVLMKRLHMAGKEGCFCKCACAVDVFHLSFNLLRSTQTNIQMPVQSRRVLHPLAPPSAVGVVFILFVLGGTRALLCLLWLPLVEVK